MRTTLNLGLDIKIPDQLHSRRKPAPAHVQAHFERSPRPPQRADLEAELADRFGPMPPSVANLLDYALLKTAAEQLLVQTVERKEDEIWMKFHEQAPVDPAAADPVCAPAPRGHLPP